MQNPVPRPTTRLWFLSLLLVGIIVLLPFTQIHPQLAQGDNGRDLYAFAHALDGKQSLVPYRDYWWIYGPFMPYYYGFWMKIAGVNLFSVLIGKAFLLLLAGVFIGLAVRIVTCPIAGFAAALWFWVAFPDFMHTYNHTGGTTCLCALTFFLIAHLKTNKKIYFWSAFFSIFLLALIKLNMGIVVLAMTTLALLLNSLIEKDPPHARSQPLYILGAITTALMILAVYALLLYGLPAYEIMQCFPYQDKYRQATASPWQACLMGWHYFIENMTKYPSSKLLGLVVAFAFLYNLWRIATRKMVHLKTRLLLLMVLLIILTAALHEYLFSGIAYCLIWAIPIWIICFFIVIGFATESLRQSNKLFLWISLFLLMLSEVFRIFVCWMPLRTAGLLHSADRFLHNPHGQVFLCNDAAWMSTVKTTTEFLEKHLAPQETFFAAPYDPLYYYLTGRLSPTWQTCFFAFNNMPPEQEKEVIRDLEKNRVNWVVLSNRSASSEAGLGVFGRDYCPLLYKYLETNFIPVKKIGEWSEPAGWAWAHGTVILRRQSAGANQ